MYRVGGTCACALARRRRARENELGLTRLPSLSPSPSPRLQPQRLQAVKGLSEAKAEKLVEAARKLCDAGSWMTGSDCLVKVGAWLLGCWVGLVPGIPNVYSSKARTLQLG